MNGASHTAALDLLVDTHIRGLRDNDLEAAMENTADAVVYELVGSSPDSIHGKQAVRAHHLLDLANRMPEREIPLRRRYGDEFVVDESIWEGRVTGRIGPLIGNGRRVSHRVLRIFVVQEGRIVHQTIYSDFAALSRQLA